MLPELSKSLEGHAQKATRSRNGYIDILELRAADAIKRIA